MLGSLCSFKDEVSASFGSGLGPSFNFVRLFFELGADAKRDGNMYYKECRQELIGSLLNSCNSTENDVHRRFTFSNCFSHGPPICDPRVAFERTGIHTRRIWDAGVFERVGPSCNWWAQYEIFGPPPSLSAFFFLQVLVSYVVHAVVSSDRVLFCY